MLTLYGSTSRNITLSEAMKTCMDKLSNPSEWVAILYSPSFCQFAKVQQDGTFTDSKTKNLDVKDVFEARVFNKQSELRWLKTPDGDGQAVLISELDISRYLKNPISSLTTDLDTIKQEYIIWGEPVNKSSDSNESLSSQWGKLAKSRIGSLYVPVTGLTAKKRVYLTAVEYLKADEEYGNVSVVEERLTGLEVR
jgi:CRISPR-associated protein (TIGR03984 family)